MFWVHVCMWCKIPLCGDEEVYFPSIALYGVD